MKKAKLVFIPLPGVGHLVSMVEFTKRLLSHDDRFSVTILVIKFPLELTVNSDTSTSLPSHPHIHYIHVPTLPPPPLQLYHKSVEKYYTSYIQSHKSSVKEIILNHLVLGDSVSLAGLVVDMFTTSMVDVAHELGVPAYVFFTSGAGFLGFVLYLQNRLDRGEAEFEESDPESDIPSYTNPVPSRVIPGFAFNKEGGYASFVNIARKIRETKGIIVNTVFELESHAVSSLSDAETPPLYTVGPVIDRNGQSPFRCDQSQRDKIMKWLDDQPTKSVIFLCFGSRGSFGAAQLRETAVGLERSGLRFLWSVRKAQNNFKMPSEYTNPEEFLPEGFLDRTRHLGLLCGWAPQVEVLAHRSVGGFVSHCGWNSILESLWYGIPIVTWPLYAEQQINAFQMVKDWGLGVELRLDYRRDGGDHHLVVADDIEKAVRCVMDGDGEVRKKVQEMSEKCRRAVVEGGSSFGSLESLIEAVLANMS